MNLRKLGVVSLLGGITAWNGYESISNFIDYYQTSNNGELGMAAFYGVGTLILGTMAGLFAAVPGSAYNQLEKELLTKEDNKKRPRM